MDSYLFWKECSKHKPGFNQIVWGYTGKKTVELVRLALTQEEYEKYFDGFWESTWESIEREKSVIVTHWQYLDRPDPPKE